MIVLWLIFTGCIATFGQTAPDSSAPAAAPARQENATKSVSQEASTLQLEMALRDEAKEHREFLRDSLEELKWFLVVIGGVGAGVLAWLNISSRREIRAQVNARFRDQFEKEANRRLEKFQNYLDDYKTKIDENTQDIASLERDQRRLGELVEDLTYAFNVLSERSLEASWQRSRRAAIRRLEAHRCHFPHLRGLGIVLGRLYKHFGEYDQAVKVLTAVMTDRDNKQMPKDTNYADLLFNRACYRNRRAEQLQNAGDLDGAEAFRATAWQDINQSVQIDLGNRIEAIGNEEDKRESENDRIPPDDDMMTLWNRTSRRKEALGKMNDAVFRQRSPTLLRRISKLLGFVES